MNTKLKRKANALKQESIELAQRAWDWVYQLLLSPYRFFKAVCFTIGLIVLSLGMIFSIYLYTFFHSIPKLERVNFQKLQKTATTRIQDRLENKITLHHWIPIKGISRDCLYAIVMSEDGTFFEHDGVNIDAIMNSVAEDIRERRTAFGASTISQQVVKNLFLDSNKTLSRKVKEIILTKSLERNFSKNEILEIYLNMAEFGPDIFGVEAASRHFFRKIPSEINAAEGAFLALMLPSPRRHYYAIFQNRNLTRQKRRKIDRILRDMLYSEFISERQYRRYVHYNYFSAAPLRIPARIPVR